MYFEITSICPVNDCLLFAEANNRSRWSFFVTPLVTLFSFQSKADSKMT